MDTLKITVSKKLLERSLSMVTPVATKKPGDLPSAASVSIASAGSDEVTLRCFDAINEMWCSFRAAVIDHGEPVCVQAHKLLAIVKRLEDGDVSLSKSGNRLVVKGGSHTARIPLDTWGVGGFDTAAGTGVEVVASHLSALVRGVVHCISDKESRFTLVGAKLQVADEKILAVATDGHRMSFVEAGCANSGGTNSDCIVPRSTLAHLSRMIADMGDSPVEVRLPSGGEVGAFVSGGVGIRFLRLTGLFPDWERFVPKSNDKVAVADREQLKDCISRAIQFAEESSRRVDVAFIGGEIRVHSVTADIGESEEAMDADHGDWTIGLAINAEYLLDAIKSMDSDKVEFRLKDDRSAVVIVPVGGLRQNCVIMPMRK